MGSTPTPPTIYHIFILACNASNLVILRDEGPKMKIADVSTEREDGKVVCNVCNKPYSKGGIMMHYWAKHGKNKEDKPTKTKYGILQDNGNYACIECNEEFTRYSLHVHFRMTHTDVSEHLEKLHASRRGNSAWNKGLTSKTDDRLAAYSERIREKIKTGDYPVRKGFHHTSASKEKLSEARSKFINERGGGGFRDVKWYKTIDSFGNECSLRGSWEVKVAEWLSSQEVQWTRNHYIKYLDETVNRTYSPDFFIPSDNTVIEVKGYYSEKDRRKMELVREQNPNLIVKILMQKEIENLNQMRYNKL